MKRTLLSIFALAGLSFCGYAAPLTPGEALQRANNSGMRKSVSAKAQNLQLSHTFNTETGEAAVYVFNSSNDQGFLLLSADDLASPVLGYSDSGEFDYANMPEQMKWWIDQYARQIDYARANNLKVQQSEATGSDWKAIAPMLTTKWNQDAPYNNDCPIYPATGQRSVTGCVATAMAQLVNYWKQPEVGKGSVRYTPNGYTIPLTLNLDDQKFDWANMLNKYDQGKYNDAQAAAVAYLMKVCGYTVNMSYTSYASGAASSNVVNALITNFGYNRNISYEQRDYYTTDEWNKLVYDELAAGRPVLYAGQSDGGGHEFVCDGYNDGFFHINWGWGGMSDGYFKLESLNPDAEGIGGGSGGFNYMQDVLKAVQPKEVANPDSFGMVQRGNLSATVSGTRITPAVGGVSSSGVWYYQYTPVNIGIGMEIASETNPSSKTITNIGSLQNISMRHGMTSIPSFNFPSSLGDGTYTCRLVIKNNSSLISDWVYPRSMPGFAYYFKVKKVGNSLTVENLPQESIKIVDAKIDGELYYQCVAGISATFSNPTNIQLNTTIIPVIFNAQGKRLLEGASVAVIMNPGETATKTWSTTFDLVGGVSAPTDDFTGYLKFSDLKTGGYYDLQVPVTVKMNGMPNPSVLSLKISDSKKETVNGIRNVWVITNPSTIKASFTLSNSGGYYNYPTYLYVGDPSSGIILGKTLIDMPGVKPGDFENLEGEISFGDAQEGKLYILGVMYLMPGGTSYGPLTSANFVVRYPSGVEEIDVDGDGVEEYYDLQGRKLNAAPEHGIYIVKKGEKVQKVVK